MAAIATISNGTNPRALYNQIITALSTVLGVTDSLQAYIQAAQAQIAVSSHYLDKDASNNLTVTDVTAGTKTLQSLLGGVVPTTFIGYPSGNGTIPFGQARATNGLDLLPFVVHKNVTITGMRLPAMSNEGYLVGLYDNLGARVASIASPVNLLTATTVTFDVAYSAYPGTYWGGYLSPSAVSIAGSTPGFRPMIHRRYQASSFQLPTSVGTLTDLTRVGGFAMYLVLSGGYTF